ncbi:MAG: right-handed parallel beta-helix repeat-containing protein [Clostridia bacterium]|nr:right-handed parallel beta-helix repeat-containing protein [Clostridia bacterium]
MNELSSLFLNVCDGNTIVLEKGKVYHVFPEDSFEKKGFFCSNTAKQHENPEGLRYSAIFLENKKDITVDGNGAEIVVHGKMTPFLLDKCENVIFKNFTLDYFCPTMTEFEVLTNADGECELKINPDCRFRVTNGELFWRGEDDFNGTPYWENRPHVQGRYVKVYNPEKKMCRDFDRNDLDFERVEQIDERTVKVTLKNRDADFVPGDIFQTRNIVRDQTGGLFQRCRNLEFENLRIKFMHGLGMVSQFCENVSFKNCDFTPAEGRTAASTADFFQLSGCRGKLTIESCKAYGAHDDYVNVHGTHLRIVEADEKKKTLVVRFMHPESWGFQAFEEGDELEFIKWDTLIPYAETKVVSCEKLNATDIRLTLDRELPSIEVGRDVVENATWTPDLYVRNCDFGPTCGRGILCTTRGEVIIENNHFHNLWGPALLLEDDCNFWFESGYTKSITFRNNLVENCEYAEMWQGAPVIRCTPKVMNEKSREFVHAKLTLENNTFKGAKKEKHLLWLEYIDSVEVKNNTFDAPYDFYEKCVGRVDDKNNTVLK